MGWSEQVERNLAAIEYERKGQIEEAIKLYEKNITEEFDGTYPYNRLIEIYLELKRKDDLIRVLEKAIEVFEDAELGDCKDKYTQLGRFKETYTSVTQSLEEVN